MKCPVCKESNDRLEFVFSAHIRNKERLLENPSDLPVIFMCPNLHFFDYKGNEIKQIEELTNGTPN